MKKATTASLRYLNLFMFFMLVLVLAANFLLMFVGWEGVGLCSYLLVGFYFQREIRHRCRQQSVHRESHRRFRFLARHLSHCGPIRHARFRTDLRRGRRDAGRNRRRTCSPPSRCCYLLARAGKSAQIPVIRLVAGCHGRTDPRLRLDPRRHHGDRGCLHGCARIVPL